MRYQSVSQEYLSLPNSKKPNPKLYIEEESQPVPNLSCPDEDHFTNPSSKPIGKKNVDVLLQWGHNKRSRGSRADSPCRNGGSITKIQRRLIGGREKNNKQLHVAMPPPSGDGGGYSRGANLRSCVSTFNKNTQERSNGHNQPQRRSQTSPPHNMQKATTFPNGSSSLHADSTNLCSELEPAPTGTKISNMKVLEWPRIYLSLSRKEKEEDFFAMKGTKLPQRPKKRPKNVDKSLQYCFPGLWLSDLTKGRYEVREKKCVKKKNRGLKGMEIDSDSDQERAAF